MSVARSVLAIGFWGIAGSILFAADSAYNQAVLADGPLYYWTFDEPGDFDPAVNVMDPAKFEDQLASQGAATRVDHAAIDSDPILGRCADFDGAQGSRFYAPDIGGGGSIPGADLIPSQLWAMEFWFKVEGDAGIGRNDYFTESIGLGATNNPGLIYDFTTPGYVEMFSGAGRTGTNGPQVVDSLWHHIVFAFYGNAGGFGVANRRELILDGAVYADTTSTFSAGFALVQLALGNCVSGVNPFEGLMDEVAIYDIGTKVAEMGYPITFHNPEAEAAFEELVRDIAGHAGLAAAPGYQAAVLAAEPLFYWSFDEPGDRDDAVNLADPGDPRDLLAAQGNASRADHAALGSGLQLGRAADFDGSVGTSFYAPDIDGSTGTPILNHVPSGLWALEFWFQIKGSTEGDRKDYFIESTGEGSPSNPGIIYDYTPVDYIEMFTGAGRTGTSGPQASDDRWHHIVFGYYGNNLGAGVANRRDIIIDGHAFTESFSGFSSQFALVELAVGNTVAGGGQNGFEGRMDEVALYDVGAKLAAQGLDTGVQNPEAEAAFGAFLERCADHRKLVSIVCNEETDAVSIAGPELGAPGAAGVTLTATFTGTDPGGAAAYAWSILSGGATLSANGPDSVTVVAGDAGEVTVEVAADDGVCPELGAVKARHTICFETPDTVTIAGPVQASVGEAVTLTAEAMGFDPADFNDRASGFSSGFGLVQLAVGNTVAEGGVNGFEGRMDELALYDVGSFLAGQGVDIYSQNPASEAAFAEVVARIAAHASLTGPAYVEAVLGEEPLFYWNFDEAGDLDAAMNTIDPGNANDMLTPQGAAARADHDAIGSSLGLGRCADFDGAPGTRFYAPDLAGLDFDLVPSQLWALEFWFQVKGSTAGNRNDYFLEVIGPVTTNNPGIIYDYTAEDFIEMYGPGGRTGAAGPQVSDSAWHHAVFAFYGDAAGIGVANRREIIIDGGDYARYSWSVVSGEATVTDKGRGAAEVVCSAEGDVVVRVEADDTHCATASDEHMIACGGGATKFLRGDTNADAKLNIADAICALGYLFGGPSDPCKQGIPNCYDSADANDDGKVDIADAIAILGYLFANKGPLPPPFGECGADPTTETPAELTCEAFAPCP